ncbi:glycoside hydrolase family 2 TIM barrel-domain containing protein [Pseudoduganella lutea]|uniref:beta-galactosidase n=1 Tax=Pseudoduganella lutea TaxID=321985 RepID=A0A4P6L518_9BURK|nr:glycoside hydrolase family 2 TIM barrel-domain containing protein [Pseudoduganella lutea]QBE66721.1 beta-galactosidase [Pseudoduganella lutea]
MLLPTNFLAAIAACTLLAAAGNAAAVSPPAAAPVTEVRYLSGTGPKTAVPWDFRVTAGRRAGAWSTIPVPSNWELQGFGGYDYGEGEKRFTEQGQYRMRFTVPPAWRGRTIRLVFEGAMTETAVRVNGVAAGAPHVGGFYRFSHDITKLVRFSPDAANVLEVDVSKRATDPLTDKAERRGDYWVFGGIFRPVWLEAAPVQAIAHTAIDARADGTLAALVTLAGSVAGTVVEAQVLDAAGKPVGKPFSATAATADGAATVPSADATPLRLAATIGQPRLWSAETPNLYALRLTLRHGGKALHTTTERFGFRTFEVRKGDGLYLNGRKIVIKGVNRHSFRPATGRALDPEDNYADARLIKSMNMNTARMSHYPPDPAFLRAADELGLYVIDELSGWQAAHGTEIGRKLVKEMVPRDVNHPSILFWANGNEGGFNFELDDEYHRYDPQRRPVIHPWAIFSDLDTKHYPNWKLLNERLQGPNLFMPTEFLHALYDGGGAASLDDYWRAMMASPFGVGGVIWALNDEGVVRTDQGGRVDPYGTYGPDGIVGPAHEKEGSYHAVRHIWSPVQLGAAVLDDRFDGRLPVDNRYDFHSLDKVRFGWRLVRFARPDMGPDTRSNATRGGLRVLAQGTTRGPAVAARGSGTLDLRLPANWRSHGADALEVTATGPDGGQLWTWMYPAPDLAQRAAPVAPSGKAAGAPRVERVEGSGGHYRLVAGAVSASFDGNGQLLSLRHGDRESALANGPRLAFARPATGAAVTWLPFASEEGGSTGAGTGTGTESGTATETGTEIGMIRRLAHPQVASVIDIAPDPARKTAYARFKLEISPDGEHWKTLFDATRRRADGTEYRFPPQPVLAVRVSPPVDEHGESLSFGGVRLGHAAQRFPAADGGQATVTTATAGQAGNAPGAWLEVRHGAGDGTGDGAKFDRVRWTLHADGTLRLDYAYRLDGTVQYHGVTFDHPETVLRSMRWLGEGPYRVWKNRLHGTWLGVHDVAHVDQQPGETFRYPESQGFFAGVRWARLQTTGGTLLVSAGKPDGYLRVGTPRISHVNTTVEFPAGDLSWLHAIPAIGEKFSATEVLGPSAAWPVAQGTYQGSLTFRFQ